ncbi:hypothetical protein HYV82_00710 [Candidatus Woesearchaeota archaeon]|nr:hypothetical protein [Candidatus Woesearchaeota archaeon]
MKIGKSRKGGGYITLVFAAIFFTIAVVMLMAVFFLIPGMNKIRAYERTISSNAANSDIYPYTISQISFLKGKAAQSQETGAELLIAAYKNKDAESFRKLDEAAKEYLSIYDTKCVTIDAWDSNGRLFWTGQSSQGCGTAFTGLASFANPLFETDVTIPTEDASAHIVVKQKSIYTATAKT